MTEISSNISSVNDTSPGTDLASYLLKMIKKMASGLSKKTEMSPASGWSTSAATKKHKPWSMTPSNTS